MPLSDWRSSLKSEGVARRSESVRGATPDLGHAATPQGAFKLVMACEVEGEVLREGGREEWRRLGTEKSSGLEKKMRHEVGAEGRWRKCNRPLRK